MKKLENLNLSFTNVSDRGLGRIAGLISLTALNLDTRQVTDAGLSVLTCKSLLSIYMISCVGFCFHDGQK